MRSEFKARCADFLLQQRRRRREMRRVARMLARGDNTSPDDGGGAQSSSTSDASADTRSTAANSTAAVPDRAKRNQEKRKHQIEKQRQKRLFYVAQFMCPEWMVIQPQFNADKWLVMPRPDGKRCIVSATAGLTTSRTKNGNVLHKWPSELPSGSRKTNGRSEEATLLDCVYDTSTRTYFVIDLMLWRGRLLYDTEASFRMWWLRSKFAEECPTIQNARGANKFSIAPATIFPCSRSGLAEAYSGTSVPYKRDGLLFFHKEGFYEPGVTPLVLHWKDPNCCTYFVNTTGDSSDTSQRVVLEVSQTGALLTQEKLQLGQLTREHVVKLKIQPGNFLRFKIQGVKMNPHSGALVSLVGPQFQEICGPSRLMADSSSQIVFQYIARNSPLTIQTVAAGIAE